MIVRLLFALALISLRHLSATPAAAGEARAAMEEGASLYAAKNYELAAVKFAAAAAKAADEKLDPAAASYNRASALLKAGKGPEAAAAFTEALRSSDPVLRKKAHYNRGGALVAAAEAQERDSRIESAIALLDQALGDYESAMRIDPDDEDPKVNHELAARKRASLEGMLKGRQQSRDQPGPAGAGTGKKQREKGEGERPPEREMTPEEAQLLLDAMKQHEAAQRHRLERSQGEALPVDKNW